MGEINSAENTAIEKTTRSLEEQIETARIRAEKAKNAADLARRAYNAKKRKAENRHKYMMGGTVLKHCPDAYSLDAEQWDKLIEAAFSSNEYKSLLGNFKRGNQPKKNTEERSVPKQNEFVKQP